MSYPTCLEALKSILRSYPDYRSSLSYFTIHSSTPMTLHHQTICWDLSKRATWTEETFHSLEYLTLQYYTWQWASFLPYSVFRPKSSSRLVMSSIVVSFFPLFFFPYISANNHPNLSFLLDSKLIITALRYTSHRIYNTNKDHCKVLKDTWFFIIKNTNNIIGLSEFRSRRSQCN